MEDSDENVMRITPLGGGNEVGRSCIILEFKGKKIMLDCGIHPGGEGLAALPFFDAIDPASIDLVLITHFHLDHAAGLPFFLECLTGYEGPVYMTHPTKAIYKWLLSDYVRVTQDEGLYTETDLVRSYERIDTVDYHQTTEYNGIKFTAYYAGHVLGAAMFLLEIAGVKVLYTGDYSREEDRHLMAAEKPPNVIPDVLICESTYGVMSHEPRLVREARFTRLVHDIVTRGGRCLLPVFALGRAQELLLILDEYWQANPRLRHVPIYYASALAKKCMAVYQTYINMMNDNIRKQAKETNPFVFKHISNLKSVAQFDDVGPCVMMASPGMLQSGLSRELLEKWAPDKRNGVIIPGYVVEGTLGKHILSEPDEILSITGQKIPRRLSVDYVSFSAHVDYPQNSEFIKETGATKLVLVHGDSNEMYRLKNALQSQYADAEVPLDIYTPKNVESVELVFKGEKIAKVIGDIASEPPENGRELAGVVVQNDYQFNVVSASDLETFTNVKLTSLTQRMAVPFRGPWELILWGLRNMWGSIKLSQLSQTGGKTETPLQQAIVEDAVTVTRSSHLSVVVEWETGNLADMIADAVMAVILQVESSPASVRSTSRSCSSHCGKGEVAASASETDIGSFLQPKDRLYKSEKLSRLRFTETESELEAVVQKRQKEEDMASENGVLSIDWYVNKFLRDQVESPSSVRYFGMFESMDALLKAHNVELEALFGDLLVGDTFDGNNFYAWAVTCSSDPPCFILLPCDDVSNVLVKSSGKALEKRYQSVVSRFLKTIATIDETFNLASSVKEEAKLTA